MYESGNRGSEHVIPNNNKEKIPMQWPKSLLVRTEEETSIACVAPMCAQIRAVQSEVAPHLHLRTISHTRSTNAAAFERDSVHVDRAVQVLTLLRGALSRKMWGNMDTVL